MRQVEVEENTESFEMLEVAMKNVDRKLSIEELRRHAKIMDKIDEAKLEKKKVLLFEDAEFQFVDAVLKDTRWHAGSSRLAVKCIDWFSNSAEYKL